MTTYENLRRRTALRPISGISLDGDALKAEGQDAATSGAISWHEQGMRWIASRPYTSDITADDLIEAIGLPHRYVHTNSNNAVGALFTSASRAKLIRRTTSYVKSTRKSNHSAVIAVWVRTGDARTDV